MYFGSYNVLPDMHAITVTSRFRNMVM